MTTYNIYNANGEYLGSVQTANPNSPTFNRIIKAACGNDAKAVKAN
ncbi:MAG: hypothetical protein IIZ59_03020 [Clostridia bacterium]|nr:hypothetical protein [Clostridia bacterium]